jgi:N-acyl-D-aspartate/D-glutamate deacylase
MLARIKRMRHKGLKTLRDEGAIHRLTGELGDWHKIDAGYIKEGGRADITVMNIDAIDSSLNSVRTAQYEGLDNFTRLVNRNNGVIKHVLINGKVAVSDDEHHEQLGKSQIFGSFLAAQ